MLERSGLLAETGVWRRRCICTDRDTGQAVSRICAYCIHMRACHVVCLFLIVLEYE